MSAPAPLPRRPRLDSLLQAAATGVLASVILYGTLAPSGGQGGDHSTWCGTALLCGDRGAADALLNVLMFLPFGMALRAWLRDSVRSASVAALFSASIETAQLFVPGRMTSVGDVLFNALGAILGVALMANWEVILRPTPVARRRLAAAAMALALGAVGILGLAAPSDAPGTPFFVQWTPLSYSGERYAGRVLSASLAGRPLDMGHHGDLGAVMRGLGDGGPLDVRFVVPGPQPAPASLFRIVDGRGRGVADLSVMGTSVVWSLRRASNLLELNDPGMVFADALADARPGDVETLRLWKEHRAGYCLEASSSAAPVCGIGLTVGRGWGMFLGDRPVESPLSDVLDVAWLILLFVPTGFFAASLPLVAAMAATAALGLAAIPFLTDLTPTPAVQLAAGLVGVLVGAMAAALARKAHRSPAHGRDGGKVTQPAYRRERRSPRRGARVPPPLRPGARDTDRCA